MKSTSIIFRFLKNREKYVREILKFQFQFKENFSENFKY